MSRGKGDDEERGEEAHGGPVGLGFVGVEGETHHAAEQGHENSAGRRDPWTCSIHRFWCRG